VSQPGLRHTLRSGQSGPGSALRPAGPGGGGLCFDGANQDRLICMATTQQRRGGLEVRSIDYVPLNERHGKVWHLGPLWFMSNAQIATLAVGLISISEGASPEG
jgi:hypothetical protein